MSAELRRNLVRNPTPTSTAGWVGVAPVVVGGWYQITASGTVPYIFTTPSDVAIVTGQTYLLSADVRTDSVGVSYVRATAHKNVGNVYYSTTNVAQLPAVNGIIRVYHLWTATEDLAAGDFNLAIVPASANGTFVNPATGWKLSARNVQIEKIGPYFDGSTPDAAGVNYSWAGPANASQSIAEYAAPNSTVPGSVRAFLADFLENEVPSDWRIIPSLTMPEVIDRPTVVIKHTGIAPHPAAPMGVLINDVLVTITDPHKDTARAEDALDNEVLDLVHTLRTSNHVVFKSATKVASGSYLAWDIGLDITSSPNPTEE